MKTFTAPAWLEKKLSDGSFTYTPVPHPDFPQCDEPCVMQIAVDDHTPFSADAWQKTTGGDGVETHTLVALDSATMSLGMLTLKAETPLGCAKSSCTGDCTAKSQPHEEGKLYACMCSSV